jgi:hypothetical protein
MSNTGSEGAAFPSFSSFPSFAANSLLKPASSFPSQCTLLVSTNLSLSQCFHLVFCAVLPAPTESTSLVVQPIPSSSTLSSTQSHEEHHASEASKTQSRAYLNWGLKDVDPMQYSSTSTESESDIESNHPILQLEYQSNHPNAQFDVLSAAAAKESRRKHRKQKKHKRKRHHSSSSSSDLDLSEHSDESNLDDQQRARRAKRKEKDRRKIAEKERLLRQSDQRSSTARWATYAFCLSVFFL